MDIRDKLNVYTCVWCTMTRGNIQLWNECNYFCVAVVPVKLLNFHLSDLS